MDSRFFIRNAHTATQKTILIIAYKIVKAQLFVIHVTIHPVMRLNISS